MDKALSIPLGLFSDLPSFAQAEGGNAKFCTLSELEIEPHHICLPLISELARRGMINSYGEPARYDLDQVNECFRRLLFLVLPKDDPLHLFMVLMDMIPPELAAAKNEAV